MYLDLPRQNLYKININYGYRTTIGKEESREYICILVDLFHQPIKEIHLVAQTLLL